MPTPNPSSLEITTQKIGRQLAQRVSGHIPSAFNRRWWTGVSVGSVHEGMNILKFNSSVSLMCFQHSNVIGLSRKLSMNILRNPRFPASPLHWGLRVISGTKVGAYLSARSLRRHIHQMAYSFIAGATVHESLPVLAQMWKQKRGVFDRFARRSDCE